MAVEPTNELEVEVEPFKSAGTVLLLLLLLLLLPPAALLRFRCLIMIRCCLSWDERRDEEMKNKNRNTPFSPSLHRNGFLWCGHVDFLTFVPCRVFLSLLQSHSSPCLLLALL